MINFLGGVVLVTLVCAIAIVAGASLCCGIRIDLAQLPWIMLAFTPIASVLSWAMNMPVGTARAPVCPACSQKLRWRDSFSFWNPWNFPCPRCKTPLEASRIQKMFALATIPLGLLVAGVAIFFLKNGAWHTRESLVFFGVVAQVLVAGAWASWWHTRFKVKGA